MEIGIVIENNYPLDREVRTRRVAKALHEAGHSTTIFARNSRSDAARGRIRDTLAPTSEQLEHARVERFSWLLSTPGLSVLASPFPFNPLWIVWLLLSFRRADLDLVVACDIKAGPTTIVAAKLLGIPVVIDVRENYVEFARVLSRGSVLGRFGIVPRLVEVLEAFTFVAADAVWVVTEERKAALDGWVRSRSTIEVVQNVPELEDDRSTPGTAFEPTWSGFTFVYVGVINDFRGLDPIVEALASLPPDADVHLAIAGEGPHRPSLEALARRLDVSDRVTFTGWIDAEAVPAFLERGDVGVIPHEVNGYTETTLPNKLFDCMRAGLPVLVTPMAPVERIVRATGCGVVIPRGAGPEAIAQLMLDLRTSTSLDEMGASARRAVETRYNWDHESRAVIETVDRLARGGP